MINSFYHFIMCTFNLFIIQLIIDLNYMIGKSKHDLNQYQVRGSQLENLINSRYVSAEQKKDWNYQIEVKEVSSKNKYKYQDIQMAHKVDFLDDMKNIIYDPKRFPEDLNMFTPKSEWKLIAFEQSNHPPMLDVPSSAFLKKKAVSSTAIDNLWGNLQLQGKLNAKLNDSIYTSMQYNLRKRALFLYNNFQVQKQEKSSLMIHFTQTTFNYQSQNDEFFALKFDEKVLKIKKQIQSRELLKNLQKLLFIASFRGVYCLRNEVPSCYLEDYITKEIQVLKGIDFVHQHKIKDIVSSRYYKEAIGGFFYLLNKQSFKHKNVSVDITLPKWLKPHFRSIPNCELNLITNVVPNKNQLMNLKIKLHESELILLNENLKYIFPFHKNYMKRSLIIYESNLQDNQINYMMNQISYPMHMIGLPKNQLSILGLQYVINAASTLYHEIVDFSYNAKLISISGSKIFNLANSNPSIKKLTLRGCYVLLGQQQQFFQGLSNNMCLQQFEIDYMDSYNDSMIKHLINYDAQIY